MELALKIIIYGNCQTTQLVYSLMLLLRGKAQLIGVDANHSNHKEQLKELSLDKVHNKIDLVITNMDTQELLPYFPLNMIITIPSIHFGGFHPDVVYYSKRSMPSTPSFFMKNPTVSAIGLWTAINKVSIEDSNELYCAEVFKALGYMDYFDVAVHALRNSYESHGINLKYIDKHIASRSVFMYGPLHPKFEVTLSLSVGICEKLNLTPVVDYEQIVSMIVDPLQREYAWGCFPPLAQELGVEGSWFIRHYDHVFPDMTEYLTTFHRFISQFQTEIEPVQMLDRDKSRFDKFHKIDSVLRRFI